MEEEKNLKRLFLYECTLTKCYVINLEVKEE
jgi:hypothetical protein